MTRFLVMGGLARAQRTGARSRRGRAAVAVGILAAALAIGTATAAQAAVGYGPQVKLPFSGVTPYGVAADAAGNVYVADWNNADMVELSAGATSSSQQVTLPFNGVAPYAVAVDAHGDVYAADYDSNRVVELPALAGGGFGPQITLPFTGLDRPRGVAVDAAGDVYVADNKVLELPAGATSSSQQVTLPFNAGSVYGVAADGVGNVYVADWNDAQVLELPAGATSSSQQITLPFNDVAPYGVAVDAHGDVYAADYDSNRVVELPAGAASSSQQVTLPFTGLGPARGVAVDAAGDAYVFDTGQVLELPVAPVPAVAKVSPASGPQAGGTSVTISGSGFTAATGVSFGTAAATSFSVNSDTSITATAPAGASAGAVDVTVTTPGGTSATGTADQYSYTAPVPAVTGVSPASGSLAGGTSVTITGSGFTGATAVDFGTLAATSFNVTSATSITATAPADSGGAVDVTVTTAGGTNATGSADQYYYLAPLHSAIYHATGGEQAYTVPAGVTAVTVTAVGAPGGAGQGEFPGPGGGCGCGGNGASVTATVAVTPGQRLYVEVGGFGTENTSGDGSGTVPGGFNGGGSSVTGGSGGGSSDVRTVSCGSPCTASGQSSLASRLVVAGGGGGGGGVNECGYPGGAAGDSSVTGPGNGGHGGTGGCAGNPPLPGNGGFGPDGTGSSGGTGGTVSGDPPCPLGNGAFGQGGNASASCFSGNNGGGGGGGWYGGGAGAGDPLISDSGGGGGAGSSFWADGATGTSMSQDTTGNAEIQISPLMPGAAVVTGLSPASGPIGTSVTITGTGFTGATAVSFGTVPATSFAVNSDTSITAIAPAGASDGPVDATVTTAAGTSVTVSADEYSYPPAVTGVSPSSGPLPGGTAVTITGSAFVGATGVSFGGVAASFTLNSDTSITAIAPAGASDGPVDVTVITVVATSVTVPADQFSYTSPVPVVTGVSPSAGPLGGGTSVVISGSGFTGATAVSFGGVAAGFTVNSDTSITATAPAGASDGAVDVTVTAAAGTSVTGTADQFSYTSPVPAVTGVSPAAGPLSGGTSVVISGSGFTGATAVSFGGVAAGFSVNTDTSIYAVVPPAGSSGQADVTVMTPGGTSATVPADQYAYTAVITGVSPAFGPLAGGTSTTITGSGFAGATGVSFAGVAVSFTVNSATSITAMAPPAGTAGPVDVTVATPGGTSTAGVADQYYYLAPWQAAPTVTFRPAGGEQAYTVPAGVTAVTVTAVGAPGGAGQGEFPGPGGGCGCGGNGASVTATVAVTPGQRLYVEVGGFGTENTSGDGSGTVPGGFNGGGSSVTGGSGGGSSDVRTVSCGSPCTASGQSSLASRLVVAGGGGGGGGVNECGYPGGAAGDSSVTGPGNGGHGGTGGCAGNPPLPGNGGFGPDGTGSSGGTGGTVSGDPPCPLGNGAFGQGGNASASCFSGNNGGGGGGGWYGGGAGAGDPLISDSGGGGGAGSSFWADGATGTSMSQDTTGNAEVQISPLKTGATPVVAGVSPASGPLAGGTSVTITGTGFTGATTVSFGEVAAGFTVNSDTSITVTTPPAGSPVQVDVTVTTPNGTSATSPNDQYTYTAPAGSTTASLTDSNGNPIAGAAVTFRPASGPATSATTGPDGTAGVVLTPGTYSVTMYYANGYQTKTLSVTAKGPNAVSFATIAVTVQISDPDSADLAAASVAHAGNTGTFGPKTAVDGNGRVTFQALPGTNTFTAYDAGGYQTRTVTVTGPVTVTFATVAVTVQISDPDSADLAAASVAHAGNTGTFGPKTAVDGNGQVTFQALPGTNTFTAYDAGGYQTRTVTVTGPVTVTFATVAVTVTVDKNGSPLTTALVAHAGNTGTFGPKTAVDGNGQVTFQVLPGTNSFTAWDGSAYTKETLTITAATSTSISVT